MKILILTKPDFDNADKLKEYLHSYDNEVNISTVNINHAWAVAKRYDLIISYCYPIIIEEGILDDPKFGFINIHTSFLPYNRGANPNVWSIINDDPAGVTIHQIDKGIDTGRILAQGQYRRTQIDTGETLYKKLEELSLKLFFGWWPDASNYMMKNDAMPPSIDQNILNKLHYGLKTNKRIDLDKVQNLANTFRKPQLEIVQQAIDIMRACTFSGYTGAYITEEDGSKTFYWLQPYKEDSLNG